MGIVLVIEYIAQYLISRGKNIISGKSGTCIISRFDSIY